MSVIRYIISIIDKLIVKIYNETGSFSMQFHPSFTILIRMVKTFKEPVIRGRIER